MTLEAIRKAIEVDPENSAFTKKGWDPIYTAHKNAKILIIGQAPGIRAQESRIPWNDPSGDNLRAWIDIDRNTFYDETKVALVPMDFYFPGSKERGDLPPRKEFAEKWHPLILENMPGIELTLLIGAYAQERYLGEKRKKNLTETVRAFKEYGPEHIPLVHPSPRNNIWQKKNPWFKKNLLPSLQATVRSIIKSN